MNLGVEEQAQRRKKGKRKSRRKKEQDQDGDDAKAAPVPTTDRSTPRRKLFQSKKMKIEQRKLGLIIGPQGKNIKELYKQTHCDILLPKRRQKQSDEVQPTVNTEFDEYEQHWNDSDFYYVYDAYNDQEQSNIKLNTDRSKTETKKSKKSKSEEDDKEDEEELDIDDPRRLVEITLRGSPEEIRDAELEIGFMIEHGRMMLPHERSGGKKPKSKKTRKRKGDSDLNGNGDLEVELDDTELAEDIRIPSKICGMLIGGGGQRIKELTDETGAEIWVDWDKESHIEAGVSTVHLKGTKYSVEYAKEEIRRIQTLFEKGSYTYRFEIPAYCSRELFGDKGANLKQLQKDYNVSITVKNYRQESRYMRIGDEEQRLQATLMIILIGEEEDQIACKKGIDKLLGIFLKCRECEFLKKEDEGYPDPRSGVWFCQRCWDEFNGVVREEEEYRREPKDARNGRNDQAVNGLNNRMGQMNLNGARQQYSQRPHGAQGPPPPQQRPPQTQRPQRPPQHQRPQRPPQQQRPPIQANRPQGGYNQGGYGQGGYNQGYDQGAQRDRSYNGNQRPQRGPSQRLVGNVGKQNGVSRNKW